MNIKKILKKKRVIIVITALVLLITILLASRYLFYKSFDNNTSVIGVGKQSILGMELKLIGNNEISRSTYFIPVQSFNADRKLGITLNMNGLCITKDTVIDLELLGSDSENYYLSLLPLINDCSENEQEIVLSVSDRNFDVENITALQLSLKHSNEFSVDVNNLYVFTNVLGINSEKALRDASEPKGFAKRDEKTFPGPKKSPHNEPTVIPTTTPVASTTVSPTIIPTSTSIPSMPNSKWKIKSVDSMKETKDRICNPRPTEFVNNWVLKAKSLGAEYVAISTPYDDPQCSSSLSYTKLWVNTIRKNGLKVWHRHMPLSFEGIYSVPKNPDIDYIDLVKNYIIENKELFSSGDIFTPIPEPQNGGINGINYCSQGTCMFSNAENFNLWLREATQVSMQAFEALGIEDIKVGYWGFDGFIAWGDNNPDWTGILEAETILAMGNLTIDHYPQSVDSSMLTDLQELSLRYPNTPIYIGEWGAINTIDPLNATSEALQAIASFENIEGFNYWHMGMGGTEALLEEDFTERPHYFVLQDYFFHH